MAVEYLEVKITDELIVVSLDMCSSSDLIEELTLKGDLTRLQHFFTSLKQHLMHAQHELVFDVYKFTGDGWILLFPVNTPGTELLAFLRSLCVFFKREFQKQILKYLDTPPQVTGLVFCLERGILGRMKMFGRIEYIGRAINIACRLQKAVGDKGGSPAYKALTSNAVFNDYFSEVQNYKVFRAKRTLRNIRGGAVFRCRKIELLSPTIAS